MRTYAVYNRSLWILLPLSILGVSTIATSAVRTFLQALLLPKQQAVIESSPLLPSGLSLNSTESCSASESGSGAVSSTGRVFQHL